MTGCNRLSLSTDDILLSFVYTGLASSITGALSQMRQEQEISMANMNQTSSHDSGLELEGRSGNLDQCLYTFTAVFFAVAGRLHSHFIFIWCHSLANSHQFSSVCFIVDSDASIKQATRRSEVSVDLVMEMFNSFRSKPMKMLTFLCAQDFRRDQFTQHYLNIHQDIQAGKVD